MTVLAWQQIGPPVTAAAVLVHGWASSGTADWGDTGFAAHLAEVGWRVLLVDLPGHGESADVPLPADREPAAWTAEVIAADLAALSVRWCAPMGFALGAQVASHLALRKEVDAGALVLIGCDDRARETNADEIAAALRDTGARMWHPEAAEAVAAARADRRHDLATLAAWIEQRSWPAAARLGAFPEPTLLAVGVDDERRERAPRLARLLHDSRLVAAAGDHRGVLSAGGLHETVAAFVGEHRP